MHNKIGSAYRASTSFQDVKIFLAYTYILQIGLPVLFTKMAHHQPVSISQISEVKYLTAQVADMYAAPSDLITAFL